MAARIRYEKTGEGAYRVLYGDVFIGTVRQMDDKQWHAHRAVGLRIRRETRGEAAESLLAIYRSNDIASRKA